MNKSESNLINRYPLAAYFILSFLFTWLILAPGVAANLGLIEFNFDGTLLTILGALGPLMAVLIVRSAESGQEGIRQTFQSIINWKVNWKWWAASVLLIGLLAVLAVLISQSVVIPGMESGGELVARGFGPVITFILFLLGSFGEEPGWRGFALPKLQKKFKPFVATLILTGFWWIWHIPTYWTLPISIATREQFGFLVAFGIQSGVLLALGIMCAWVFNGSKGSVLMPVLLHAGWNICSLAISQEASTFLLPLFLITALIVSFTTRGKLGLEKRSE
jgi:membrane protease YdiL (CAAX protease family)